VLDLPGSAVLSPRATPGRLALGILLALTACLAAPVHAQATYDVLRVVDGDTVVLNEVGPVRLIGVDTPETKDPRKPVQYYGIEASAFLQSMLSGQSVRVAYDHQRRDKYQRTLAYLYLSDGTFVNREIIRQGFGHAYLTYPFAYAEDFRAVEREAREAERGLWGQAPAKSAPVEPSRVWVNTSSRVYHCPGTRYYGNTASGKYLSEAAAEAQGHRPAGGRRCGGVAAASPQTAAVSTAAPPAATSARDVRVWVNTSSRVYHCPGTRYYGTTKSGVFLGQREADAQGFRPAGGRACS
jgi:micrococcal nuclease